MPKRVESPSSINTFKQCKRKYYHQYIEKLPTIPNIHQVRGSVAHKALEKFYDLNPGQLTEDNYQQLFRSRIQTLFFEAWTAKQNAIASLNLSEDQLKFYFEETMFMLLNWTNHFIDEFDALRNGSALGETFRKLTPLREKQFRSDNYSVQGFIDAIHELEQEVQIIDYKTNASLEFKDEIKLQLAIYSLLYFEKYGKKPEKAGIFFLRHKKKMMSVDEELLDLARREIECIHSHTSGCSTIDEYPKSPGPLCRWSTGQCDFFEVCKPFE